LTVTQDDPSVDPPVRPPTAAERQASLPFRVRFDEATPDGRIRTSVLLRFAAELAGVHSAQRGFGREWYRRRGLAWLVRGVDLEILRPIVHGDELTGTTEPVAARKVLARRATRFIGPDGQLVARLTVDWALTDERGAPTRIPALFGVAFGMVDRTFAPIRVRAVPPAGAPLAALELIVRPHELDPMGHVNNAVYLDWAEEALAAQLTPVEPARTGSVLAAVPRHWQLEYLGAAGPARRVTLTAWRAERGWYCRVVDAVSGEVLVGACLEA
jgi:acyl-CoA thioesterase FadM